MFVLMDVILASFVIAGTFLILTLGAALLKELTKKDDDKQG